MAASNRKNFSENINIALVAEVNARCPKCNQALMYEKTTSLNKKYELAHIYPFSPRAHEVILLQNEIRLHQNPDHVDNLIALCLECHHIFDNPRTVEGYREMVAIKKALFEKTQQFKMIDDYQIESEIIQVLQSLEAGDVTSDEELSLDPKSLNEKINKTMSPLTKSRIEQNVTGYFSLIRTKLSLIEKSTPNAAERISIQIKSFYLQQAKGSESQQLIYRNIVAWLQSKTGSPSTEACEILTSFFIQNCEIFK